jgi:hypothetical protein
MQAVATHMAFVGGRGTWEMGPINAEVRPRIVVGLVLVASGWRSVAAGGEQRS